MRITGFLTTKPTWKTAVCASKSVISVSAVLMIVIAGTAHVTTAGAGIPGTTLITHGAGITTVGIMVGTMAMAGIPAGAGTTGTMVMCAYRVTTT